MQRDSLRDEPLHHRRTEDAREEDEEREDTARRHFPNLVVTPRESDEYPTFWED